ncbi:MAG: dihydrofolate reductase family protein, partial [Microbacteriaceae bacterium]
NSFIREGLVEEYIVCIAPMLLGGTQTSTGDLGIDTLTQARKLSIVDTQHLGGDIVVTAREAH